MPSFFMVRDALAPHPRRSLQSHLQAGGYAHGLRLQSRQCCVRAGTQRQPVEPDKGPQPVPPGDMPPQAEPFRAVVLGAACISRFSK